MCSSDLVVQHSPIFVMVTRQSAEVRWRYNRALRRPDEASENRNDYRHRARTLRIEGATERIVRARLGLGHACSSQASAESTDSLRCRQWGLRIACVRFPEVAEPDPHLQLNSKKNNAIPSDPFLGKRDFHPASVEIKYPVRNPKK